MSELRSSEMRVDPATARGRGAFLVVALLFVLSGLIAWQLRGRYSPELAGNQDLMIALMYFMEDHDGRLPASEAEFRGQSYVEGLDNGAVRIHVKPEYEDRYRRPSGVRIADLGSYAIAWGRAMDDLVLDDYGNTRGADKEKVELIRWAASPPSGKTNTQILLRVRDEMMKRKRGQ